MALLAVAHRRLLGIAYAPYTGKGTGERALVRRLLVQLSCQGLLFLLDAGLYTFDLLWHIIEQGGDFLVKVPLRVKFKRVQRLPDGSWLAELTGQIPDPDCPPTPTGRKRWKTVTLTVRVIRVEIPGFRPFWLMTSLLDPAIPAREIALHYHRRWDVEIAYDEIKTHQCATLRGQSPTTFRSKRPDLVEQEIYALAIMYNLIRTLICQAATQHGQDPLTISFLDALEHIIEAVPMITAAPTDRQGTKRRYLLAVIADCRIDRPRRPRLNPRVVKVKMSRFARKRPWHKSEMRDIAKELRVIDVEPVGVPPG
jgi:hypothetical protein